MVKINELGIFATIYDPKLPSEVESQNLHQFIKNYWQDDNANGVGSSMTNGNHDVFCILLFQNNPIEGEEADAFYEAFYDHLQSYGSSAKLNIQAYSGDHYYEYKITN